MKKQGNNRRTIALLLVLLPFMALAQDTAIKRHEFTVQQAVDYATKNNVQVKNALLDVQMQKQVNREVTGNAYPQISGSVAATYNAKLPISLIPAEVFGGPVGQFQELPFGTRWNSTYGISANQLLFDGQVFTGLQARKTLIDFRSKNVEITEETIRANVYKIYYQLVVSKTQVELLDSNISMLNKLLHDTKIIYDNGFAEKLDVDKVTVQVVNLQTEKENLVAQIANGYAGLKVLMGMPQKDILVLTDEINDDMIKDGALAIGDFNYAQRRDYQYAELGLKLAKYDIQRYKLSKIPTVSLNGYYNRNAQRDKFNFFKGGERWFDISAITLNINVPIFNGFAKNAKIEQAKITYQQNQNQIEALKLNIDSELETARNNFNAAIRSMDYQKKNMVLAETVFQQTKKKYEVGTGSQTEINTAQTDYKVAQTNYITAMYNAIIARVDFLKATGKL